METMPATMSVEDAAVILGVSRRAAYRAATKGELPTVRIGRRLLVPSAKLCELLGLDFHLEADPGTKVSSASSVTS